MLSCALACVLAGCEDRGVISKAPGREQSVAPFNEPGLRAKLIDKETKQPIEGAVIYGYYATQSGTQGGGKSLVQMVKSFETVSDKEGVFEFAPWQSGASKIEGQAISLFPMIMIYKPGYDMEYDTLKSLKQWRPKSQSGGEVKLIEVANGATSPTRDWTHLPFLMTPAKTERDRYAALNDSSVGIQFIGDCGWEAYSKTLLARHNAWKDWYVANVPRDQLTSEGYPKDSYKIGQVAVLGISNPTTVDMLLRNFESGRSSWKCANPVNSFAEKK